MPCDYLLPFKYITIEVMTHYRIFQALSLAYLKTTYQLF